MQISKIIRAVLLICLLQSAHRLVASDATSAGKAFSGNPGVPWPAVDALGRKLPTFAEVGGPKADRFTGMFYFLWHDQQNGASPAGGPYDIAKILAHDADALRKPESPLWGPIGMYHYWAEPLYGYYASRDEWVLRRHAQLLADAGIDTLIFDTTNAATYRDTYLKLCQVFQKIRQEGGRTPQIAFMVNTEAGKTAGKLFHDLYEPALYKELWFYWQGKPLMLCDPEAAQPEWKNFFTLRAAHWPFTLTNTPYAWHWEATYPQPYGFVDDPTKPEQVNVSVAQNLRASDGKVTNMSEGNARGRSFHDGKMDRSPGAVLRGYNVEEQWKRVYALNPPFAMVTGWNEWIAGRWGNPRGPIIFVDQYDEEYSRDIEPMKGGHGDNYYWQLISGVRRYKGTPPLPKSSAPVSIRLPKGFAQWGDVQPEFRDAPNDTLSRSAAGVAGLSYTNATGRNDIISSKVARDRKNIYFYVKTREPITAATGSNWMWLLISTRNPGSKTWEGYDFVVNRTVLTQGKTLLEQNNGGWNWKKANVIDYRLNGNEMQLCIPRPALGLKTGPVSIDFKWADHIQQPGNIMDFYSSGDVAPEGRFMFRYEAD
jgi:hypothetical protein